MNPRKKMSCRTRSPSHFSREPTPTDSSLRVIPPSNIQSPVDLVGREELRDSQRKGNLKMVNDDKRSV